MFSRTFTTSDSSTFRLPRLLPRTLQPFGCEPIHPTDGNRQMPGNFSQKMSEKFVAYLLSNASRFRHGSPNHGNCRTKPRLHITASTQNSSCIFNRLILTKQNTVRKYTPLTKQPCAVYGRSVRFAQPSCVNGSGHSRVTR